MLSEKRRKLRAVKVQAAQIRQNLTRLQEQMRSMKQQQLQVERQENQLKHEISELNRQVGVRQEQERKLLRAQRRPTSAPAVSRKRRAPAPGGPHVNKKKPTKQSQTSVSWARDMYGFVLRKAAEFYFTDRKHVTLVPAVQKELDALKAVWEDVLLLNAQVHEINEVIAENEYRNIGPVTPVEYPAPEFWASCLEQRHALLEREEMWSASEKIYANFSAAGMRIHNESWGASLLIPLLNAIKGHTEDDRQRKSMVKAVISLLRSNPFVWMICGMGGAKELARKFIERPEQYGKPTSVVRQELARTRQALIDTEALVRAAERRKEEGAGAPCPSCKAPELRYEGQIGAVGVGKGTIVGRWKCAACGDVNIR